MTMCSQRPQGLHLKQMWATKRLGNRRLGDRSHPNLTLLSPKWFVTQACLAQDFERFYGWSLPQTTIACYVLVCWLEFNCRFNTICVNCAFRVITVTYLHWYRSIIIAPFHIDEYVITLPHAVLKYLSASLLDIFRTANMWTDLSHCDLLFYYFYYMLYACIYW